MKNKRFAVAVFSSLKRLSCNYSTHYTETKYEPLSIDFHASKFVPHFVRHNYTANNLTAPCKEIPFNSEGWNYPYYGLVSTSNPISINFDPNYEQFSTRNSISVNFTVPREPDGLKHLVAQIGDSSSCSPAFSTFVSLLLVSGFVLFC